MATKTAALPVPERLRGFYALNPLVGVIENFRRVMLQGVAPDFYSLGISAAIAAILLPLATIVWIFRTGYKLKS